MTLHFKQVVYLKYQLTGEELLVNAGVEGEGVVKVWGEEENS
jgi:hypothetical protein